MEKPSVLVAEDNESTCALLAALLRRDFELEFATDGAEAIERLRSRRYSAVVLDLVMPVVDGFGVLEFLANERPEMTRRVVVLTAALTQTHMDRLAACEFAQLVSKPFELEVLHEAVARVAKGDRPGMRGPVLTSGMLLLLAELVRRVQ